MPVERVYQIDILKMKFCPENENMTAGLIRDSGRRIVKLF